MSQITVKAYLKRGGQQKRLLEQSDEIRRFAIDCDVTSSFEYLMAKINSVFPGLTNKSITTYWKDSDGDMIAFSSDDELMEALKSITDGMFRVYIVENKHLNQGSAPAADSSNVLHFGVTCDGCSGEVRGIRYKCQMCPDYDLCMKCKAQSIHSEHEMTAIEQPQCLFPGFGRGPFFGNWMNSMPFPQHPGSGAAPSPYGFHMPPRPAFGCFPPGPGMGPAAEMPGAEPEQADTAEARRMNRRAWKRWYKEMWCDHKRKCKKEKKEKREEKREKSKEKKEDKSSSSSSSESEVESPTGDYLKNVGHSVAAMLDPLGIDVEVDVEHHGRRRRCHRDMSGNPWGMWGMRGGHGPCGMRGGGGHHGPWGMRGAGHGPWGMRGGCGGRGRGGWGGDCQWKRGCGTTAQDPTPMAADPSSQQNPSEQKQAANANSTAKNVETNLETGEMGMNGADHEWMLVNNGGSPTAADVENATDSVRDLHVADNAGPSDLMSFSVPSDPRIAEALESMMSMGYTNEGGWLTNLLVHYNGDIGRVLDTLQAKK